MTNNFAWENSKWKAAVFKSHDYVWIEEGPKSAEWMHFSAIYNSTSFDLIWPFKEDKKIIIDYKLNGDLYVILKHSRIQPGFEIMQIIVTKLTSQLYTKY